MNRSLARLGLAVVWVAASFLQAQPAIQTFTLPTGLRCVLMEKHDQPHIRVELTTRWNAAEEPPARKGLAPFLAAMMRAGGAGPYTRPDFNRAMDDLGLQFVFESQRCAFRWILGTDSRSQEPAMELLADAVFRPVFDGPMVEARRQALVQQSSSISLRDLGVARFLWNLGDPGAEPPPSRQGVNSIDFNDLQAFRRRVLVPGASTLVIYGDLSLTQAKELIHLHFGLWGGETRAEPAKAAPESGPGDRLVASLDPSPEAELWAGREPYAGPAEVGELLAILLEQGPRAVAPGLALACSLESGRPLLIKLKAGAAGRAVLVGGLRSTLEDLRSRGFTAQEVTRARLRWKARLTALPLHPGDLIHRYGQGVLDPGFQAKVEAVGVQQINSALASLLAPDALRYLLLGGDDELVQAAEKAGLGPVTLVKP